MCTIFEIQVCIELRQKIVKAILKFNLCQQCVNKTFAEDYFKFRQSLRHLPRYFLEDQSLYR